MPGCHTQAKTIDELLDRTKEAIRAYLKEDNQIKGDFIGVQYVEL